MDNKRLEHKFMKRIWNRWFVALFAAVAALAGGCTDPAGVVDELNLDRVLSPMNFEVRIENNVNANFMWTAADGVKNYQLDLQFDDGTSYEVLTIAATGESSMEYRVNELPGQRLYTAYLYALSEDPNTANSKASIVSFETGIEQLFLNEGVVADADILPTEITLRWLAGSNVTHLELSDGANTQRIDLDEAAKAAGVYTLTGLTTDKLYTVKIFRDVAERGVCSFAPTTIYPLVVVEKGAETMTIGWASTAQIDEVRVSGGELNAKSFKVASGAASCAITGLDPLVEYHFMAYYQGIYHGRIVATTMGAGHLWDFTKWEAQTFAENTTIDGLTILATSAKPVTIEADPNGIHRLNLGGKSTLKSGVPTERALQFEVACDGVVALDCHRDTNGERGFAVYVEALGTSTEFVIAPTKDNRATIYIPVTGITEKTNIMIWSDNTMRHTYSLEWTEGAEAPGQFAEPLATTTVTVDPTMVNQGTAAAVAVSWTAVENAKDYTWALSGASNIGGTTAELQASLPAEAVAALEAGKYTLTVTANPVSTYKYKASKGTADFVVSDLVLAAPKVTLTPAKVEQGSETEVVASWEAVMNAASYAVSFNGGAATTQTETTYTLSAAEVKALAVGEYKISVVALPDPTDADRQQSAAGEATLTVEEPAPVTPPSGNVPYHWDEAYFTKLHTQFGDNVEVTQNFSIDGLNFRAGGGKFKMKTSGGKMAINLQSSGSPTKCALWFTVGGPGKMMLTVRSGTSSEERNAKVCIGGVTLETNFVGPGAEPKTYEVDCSSAKAGDEITIYGEKAIFVFDIEWIPAAAEPVVYEWNEDFFVKLTQTYALDAASSDEFSVDGLNYRAGGKTFKMKSSKSKTCIQLTGEGDMTKCALWFKASGPGTLDVSALSGSSSEDRAFAVCIAGKPVVAEGFAAPGAAIQDHTIDCSAAKEGDEITIYSKVKGVNIFNIKWTGK